MSNLVYSMNIGKRAFFFNVRQTKQGSNYLRVNITQDGRGDQTLVVFTNELVGFYEGCTAAYEKMLGAVGHEEPPVVEEPVKQVLHTTPMEEEPEALCYKCGAFGYNNWHAVPGRYFECLSCGHRELING